MTPLSISFSEFQINERMLGTETLSFNLINSMETFFFSLQIALSEQDKKKNFTFLSKTYDLCITLKFRDDWYIN